MLSFELGLSGRANDCLKMSFLSWAADVLEKVDQSAAGLSDTGKTGRRRRRRKDLPDGRPGSDVDGTSEQETDASVDFDGRSQLLGVAESPGQTASGSGEWDRGLSESAVAKLAKAPSLTIEQLRSVRRNLSDKREWSQPNQKKVIILQHRSFCINSILLMYQRRFS